MQREPWVTVIATLPPPTTGMTSVTQLVVESLRSLGEVEIVNLSRGKAAKRRSWKLVRSFRQLQATVGTVLPGHRTPIYMALNSGPAIGLDCMLMIAARLRSRSVFVHHHSFSYLLKPAPLMRLLYLIGGRHIHDIALCAGMARLIQEQYGRSDVTVVTNPVEGVARELAQRDPQSGIVLGHLANLSVAKGISIVIEAFAKSAEAGENIRLHLAGPFTSEETRSIVMGAVDKWPDKVTYFGPVYGKDKVKFFEGIDVFLYPTQYHVEAQPLVLLEALAAGSIIMSVDRGCIADLVAHPGSGVVTLFDIDSFSRKVADAVANLSVEADRLRYLQRQAIDESNQLSDVSRTQLDSLVAKMFRGS